MNAAGRLAAYGAGLVVAFGGAFAVSNAVVPESTAQAWKEGSQVSDHSPHGSSSGGSAAGLAGLSLSQGGYVLSAVSAPATAKTNGDLRFQIDTASGAPLTKFATTHDKDLHLIVVRSDGSGFRHVHPTLDAATGTWSVPWQWQAAGTYRVFADFQPADVPDAPKLTLTRAVDIAGAFTPVDPGAVRTVDQVGGFTVTLDGALAAGSAQELTATVTRDGNPVTSLQPYLGAFGHLVALRDGDLAYLHIHPEGAEPTPGQAGGPVIAFAAEAPTPGKYLLYLDFQVDGTVHTATFVVNAESGDATPSADGSHEDGHAGGH
ncbi:heavy-metal-associated domain-containing protein [Mycobacteroides abscessus subsp. abscessus]|uniref:heavy-metal-associated domain-containing protein n=1 Tax=Mycobacteroides abscessus TaxID=36809 RepID=UPI00266B9564|nr:heavy-metal-associated domain-containing protein [Mycobacteroides abscessus]MDO3012721.1 heavy-metal-associated domain-containing protein [Mycobacteroides abscessus subsp. abscessus]